MNDAIKMQISAFIDGELPDNESELLLRRMSQDAELRQQAAEYLALGRALRNERSVPGTELLRERIAAAIDDKTFADEFDAIEPVGRRYMRPVAGIVIAATVALAAILGLRQITGVPELDAAPGTSLATEVGDGPSYTVPDAKRELHDMEAGKLDALLATFEAYEEDIEALEDDAGADDAADNTDVVDRQTP